MNTVILKNNETFTLDKNDVYDIIIEKGAFVNILEKDLSNSQININVLDDAMLKYCIVNTNTSDTKRNITANRGAHLAMVETNLCKTIDETEIVLAGEHSEARVENLCVVDGYDQIVKTRINHEGADSISMINNIGVAISNTNIMFDTIGYVKKGVARCDCRQLSKGVIVGNNAKVTTKPILLIDEYDVMAYHGATIGKMSDDELFYLMSRGLTKNEAFMLILDGLINPIVSKYNDTDKDAVNKALTKLLKED